MPHQPPGPEGTPSLLTHALRSLVAKKLMIANTITITTIPQAMAAPYP